MVVDDPGKRRDDLREGLARVLEMVGFPHAIARIYAALTMAPGEGLPTSELMTELDISKATVSTTTQFLVGVELVERYRVPGSREAHYRILKGKWGDILGKKFMAMGQITTVVRAAKEGTNSPAALERLTEMEEVYSFFTEEFVAVMNRWDERMGR
jgi:DNA-binding transcriptional regulator GbsR (MarR family)